MQEGPRQECQVERLAHRLATQLRAELGAEGRRVAEDVDAPQQHRTQSPQRERKQAAPARRVNGSEVVKLDRNRSDHPQWMRHRRKAGEHTGEDRGTRGGGCSQRLVQRAQDQSDGEHIHTPKSCRAQEDGVDDQHRHGDARNDASEAGAPAYRHTSTRERRRQ